MKTQLLLIPVVIGAGFLLASRVGSVGSDIVLPGDVVQGKIKEYASKWGLEFSLVKAIAKVESNFNPMAKNPSDPSYGLMQITPILAYDYGLIRDYVNPSELEIEMIYNIDNNLCIACWFLKKLSKYSFQQQVMSYNVGEAGYKQGRRNDDYFNKVRGYYEKHS